MAKRRGPGRPRTQAGSGEESIYAILRRIDQRLLKLGLTDRAASVATNMSRDLLHSIRKQARKGTQHGMNVTTLHALARVLQTSPEWLSLGTGPEDISSNGNAHTPAPIQPSPQTLRGRARRARTVVDEALAHKRALADRIRRWVYESVAANRIDSSIADELMRMTYETNNN